MSEKKSFDVDYAAPMADYMNQVMRIVVAQDDYCGMGGHGARDDHHGGPHSQVSIGLSPATTVNFREFTD